MLSLPSIRLTYYCIERIKGTKTIQFTLEFPNEQEKGWVVRPKSSRNHQANSKKKAAKKKIIDEKREMFPAETLERLRQVKNTR